MTENNQEDGVEGDSCSNCGESFGYEIGWDDPPKGKGHIEVLWNPADEPSFVVGETRRYCSIACLKADRDDFPSQLAEEDRDG